MDSINRNQPESNRRDLQGAEAVRDRETIERLWDPFIKTWFTQGVDDPRITVV